MKPRKQSNSYGHDKKCLRSSCTKTLSRGITRESPHEDGVGSGEDKGSAYIRLSFLKRRQDIVPRDLHCPGLEVKIEVVVSVLLPQLAATDEVIEVERVEAADVRQVDQVPGAAQY